uniref:PinX1-related protein 1 n=1 Tax=Heterosigma akashiwo TaxID=2829 RepID=A0A7S4D8K4_HETAK
MAASAVAVARSNLKDNLNSHWKNDKTGFGFRMLSKMGWSEGKGLGKNEDGNSSHIIVSKKTDALGLGCDKDTIGNSGWSSSIQSFTDVLAQLNAKYGSAEKDSKKKKKKSTKKALTLSGKRVMYSKMTKAKDISNYTADEKAKVLGLMNAAGSTETGSSSSDKSGSKKKRKKESKSKRKAQEEEADESTETDSVSNSSTDEKTSEKKPSKKKKKTKMTTNGQQQDQTTAAEKTMEKKKKKKKKAKTTRSDGH